MSDTASAVQTIATMQPAPALLWLETPSNALLKIADITALSAAAHQVRDMQRGVPVLVDASWTTPVALRPLQLGADLVLHSTTKFINGHSDSLGGAIVARTAAEGSLFASVRKVQAVGHRTRCIGG